MWFSRYNLELVFGQILFSSHYYFLLRDVDWIKTSTTGSTMLHVSMQNMLPRLIPIPPYSEQKRIVKRLNELLPEIDELKIDEGKLDVLREAFPKKMKDSILQCAVEGKLTEQLPSDGDARDLLKEIQKEKDLLVKEGKTKKHKPLPEISEDEIPFDIPENWCWVRLGSISYDHDQKNRMKILHTSTSLQSTMKQTSWAT